MFNESLLTSPSEYFPEIYDGVLEMQELSNAEKNLFNVALAKLDALWANQFILTCDEHGVAQFEKVLNITADENVESLDFRRLRVLNRYTATPPFSMLWLSSKLDELLGVGAWTYEINYATRTLYVEAAVASSSWAQEISVTITNIKPANLVFIMRPLIAKAIFVDELIATSKRSNNYRLGTSWMLGKEPFTSFAREEEILMAGISTIQNGMLNSLATFTLEEIGYVVVNDTFTVLKKDFLAISATENTVSLQYTVPAAEGLGVITNTKLYSVSGTLLAEANVYVDGSYDVILKHTFMFKEGE